MTQPKRILVTPLDWGLGHATRCIPVIRELIANQCRVMIAGNGNSLLLLKEEFPQLEFVELPGYDPVYPKRGNMAVSMALQLPKFVLAIRRERRVIEALIKEHKIDIVISDNRYGCWSDNAFSVFISHQSNILMPRRFGFLAGIVRKANENAMRKFNRIWIPDYPGGHSLAGELIAFGKNEFHHDIRYIGALSRFEFKEGISVKYDVIGICSGPEPQRSLLESILHKSFINSGMTFMLIRGIVSQGEAQIFEKGSVVNFLGSQDLQNVIAAAGMVIARSGYSTVMDMKTMRKKVIFIPTPGQTEQEYLARVLKEKRIAYSVEQDCFDLATALKESTGYHGFARTEKDNLLSNAVQELLIGK